MNQQIRLHNIVQNDYSLLQCVLYINLFEKYTYRVMDSSMQISANMQTPFVHFARLEYE